LFGSLAESIVYKTLGSKIDLETVDVMYSYNTKLIKVDTNIE